MTQTAQAPDEVVSLAQQVKDALALEKQIDSLLDGIKHDERQLATSYVQLGILLNRVRSEQHWITWGYKSYGEYMKAIGARIDKGRTQLYQVAGIAEKLLPQVSEQDLQTMGVSKAIELKRVVMNKPEANISLAVIEKAKDPTVTVERLRGEIFQEHNIKPEHAGTYYDFGGTYFTKEERDEFLRAVWVAMQVDPVIKKDIPDWAKKKEIMLRFAREFLSTHEATVMHER